MSIIRIKGTLDLDGVDDMDGEVLLKTQRFSET